MYCSDVCVFFFTKSTLVNEFVHDFEIMNYGHVFKGKQMKCSWEQTSAGHMDNVQPK